jgi:hypothetical protein
MNRISISILLSLMFFQYSYSQKLTTQEKKTLVEAQIEQIKANQKKQLNNRNPFVTGIHFFSPAAPNSHPYFEDKLWQEGKIVFEGNEYQVNALKYDIFKDAVIYYAQFEDAAYSTALNKEFIKEFYIGKHHFTYYDDSLQLPAFMTPGYYEVIDTGRITFLVKYTKEEIISSSYKIEYKEYTRMILYRDGKYHRFFNQLTLLHLLKDKKKELRSFIKGNNIYFNVNKIDAAKTIINHYNKLEEN